MLTIEPLSLFAVSRAHGLFFLPGACMGYTLLDKQLTRSVELPCCYSICASQAYDVRIAPYRYNVHYPDLYGDKANNRDAQKFNCVQRGHQNSLENYPQVNISRVHLLFDLFNLRRTLITVDGHDGGILWNIMDA
jgi:hypothetical protein